MIKRKEITSLDLKNVSVVNPSGKLVFDEITLNIPINRFCWVNGSGGSGRSLFLKLLSGLTSYTGSYRINETPLEEMDYSELQKYRLNMGYSFDFGGLLSNKTLFENLILPLNYHSVGSPAERQDRINELVEIFQIDQRVLNLRPADVQGSVRKTVCVARAFVFQPETVFLDDPTAGMNAYARVAFQKFLRQRKARGLKNVFVTSDDVDFWREFIDDVLLVDSGKVRQVGGIAA